MKAIWIEDYSGIEALHYGERPAPEPGPREVLVRVAAASVNPIDWKICEGMMRAFMPLPLPFPMGRDFSGTVIATGAAARDIAVGAEVFGVVDGMRGGAQAAIVATDQDLVAPKPRRIDLRTAGSLGISGASALIALEDTARLAAGERVLIHGGAGGVGGVAVQIAKARGAWVAATCRGSNRDYVSSLGADRVIDYAAEDFAATLADLDVVFDTMGGEIHRRSQGVLRPGGRLVYLVAAPLPQGAPRPDITIARADVRARRGVLERIAALVDDGKLKPQIAAVLPLAAAAKAYAMCREGNFRGKILLDAAE